MLLRKIDHPKVEIHLYDDGYIHVHFRDNAVIDIQLQDELLYIYLELTEGKLYRFLFTGGEFVSISKEARYHANEIEDISPLGASAIVLSNLAHKIIADFYYRINKPKRPYKVLWSKEKAVKWLLDSEKLNTSLIAKKENGTKYIILIANMMTTMFGSIN